MLLFYKLIFIVCCQCCCLCLAYSPTIFFFVFLFFFHHFSNIQTIHTLRIACYSRNNFCVEFHLFVSRFKVIKILLLSLFVEMMKKTETKQSSKWWKKRKIQKCRKKRNINHDCYFHLISIYVGVYAECIEKRFARKPSTHFDSIASTATSMATHKQHIQGNIRRIWILDWMCNAMRECQYDNLKEKVSNEYE